MVILITNVALQLTMMISGFFIGLTTVIKSSCCYFSGFCHWFLTLLLLLLAFDLMMSSSSISKVPKGRGADLGTMKNTKRSK